MRLALSIIYLFFYFQLAVDGINEDISQERYPYWLTALEVVFRGCAVVCIIFYIIRFRPLARISKIVPVLLVMFDMFWFYYREFAIGHNFWNFTPLVIVLVVLLSPSWYFCFRYGYLKEIKAKRTGFVPIFFVITYGIIVLVVMPKTVGLTDDPRRSAARGVAGAMSTTIAEKHANYLKSGNDYTATNVVSDTQFVNGFAIPTVAGNVITWVGGNKTFTWTYTPRNGDKPAYFTEDSTFFIHRGM